MSGPLPGARPRRPLAFLLLPLLAVLLPAGCEPDRPEGRLVVVVMVDQLSTDLLDRYADAFEGGLRRVLDEGRVFTEAVHDHAITFTGPGHATPVTGVVPARHGIVGNSWRERDGDGWRSVSADTDTAASLLERDGSGRSPVNLLRDGLPDWLAAADPAARVVSLSGKAPVAILMAGRNGGTNGAHAYWFDTGVGGFTTSDAYRDALPEWVRAFNAEAPERLAGDGCWRARAPAELAGRARRDTTAYEADGVHTHFPHCEADEPYRGAAHFISRTPLLDALTLELAREAVQDLGLGAGGATDYLAVGLSATDRVGHAFGPYSREQLENLLLLDRELGDFLAFLDETVGRDGYLLALSSDHGVLPLPEHLAEQEAFGMRVHRALPEELERATAAILGDEAGVADGGIADALGAEGRARLAERLEEVEWIERAMTLELLAADPPAADSFLALYRNSFHPDRLSSRLASHGVELQLVEGALNRESGTTHGVPHLHDRAVPLLFVGEGIAPGWSDEPARTVDLAPTLAALLGIEAPADLDGRPLLGGR